APSPARRPSSGRRPTSWGHLAFGRSLAQRRPGEMWAVRRSIGGEIPYFTWAEARFNADVTIAGLGRSLCVLALLAVASLGPVAGAAAAADTPSGQLTLAHNTSIVPRWFDPAESEGLVTPFIFYYALHDALVKPMPGQPMAPCLAESWSASADGLTYDFVL